MTKEEYERKFVANTKYSGFGMDTTIHMPCPFCAEPEWRVCKILEVEADNQKEAVCKHCGRGSKVIFNKDSGGFSFEIVQTCGDDAPDYIQPPMRRV